MENFPKNPLFSKTIILDIANNHFGSVNHAKKIIDEIVKIKNPLGYRVLFKLQFRNLDTFIHPEAPKDSHYVKRFESTRLNKIELLEISNHISRLDKNNYGLIITPFDESSVDWCVEANTDFLKVASCSANDWPLLEKIADADLPVIASTGGLDWMNIDNIVSFFQHRAVDFSLMHCISVYPTLMENCNISLISSFIKRYPNINIGWSTHEPPENTKIVIAAITAGAKLLERHVCLPEKGKEQNKYSSNPQQIRDWYKAINDAEALLGSNQIQLRSEEINSIQTLMRGVYSLRDIKKGAIIEEKDLFIAFPVLKSNQLDSSNLRFPIKCIADIKKNEALIPENNIRLAEKKDSQYLKESIHEVKALLAYAKVPLNSTFTLEISHHKGKRNFSKVGTTIINCINREYCKKILVQLPGQNHPLHYHPRKEETFQVLYGQLNMISDNHKYTLNPGETLTVLPGVWHSFGSKGGCVFEEISSTHFDDDSVYKDKEIRKLKRKDRKTIVDHWGRFQI